MVRVKLWGSLRRFADDQDWVTLEARNFKELLEALRQRYPALGPQIDRGVSLSVDGVIYREAWFTPIGAENELVLMPYMVGG